MKDRLGELVKRYGLYAVLATALIISAAVTVAPRKSDSEPVVIIKEYSADEESSITDDADTSETASKPKKIATTTKVTTTKATKATSAKTKRSTTVKASREREENETVDYEVDFPIDINLVTFDELIAINGVGESTANAILDFRDRVGVITYMEQLLEISGIGESKLELLSQYLYVDDADYSPPTTTAPITTSAADTTTRTQRTTTVRTNTTTTRTTTEALPIESITVSETETEPPEPERQIVNINEADADEIAECLLIDIELAEAIIDIREQLGGEYENYLQLLYVRGISREFLLEIRDYIEI